MQSVKRDTKHESALQRDQRDLEAERPDANVLLWLPSPMGDAILCTPALRAIRRHFASSTISFLANPVVREILSPSAFNDEWLEDGKENPFAIAAKIRKRQFTHAILFKNSFASAMAVFWAGIPSRIGYAREGRSVLLSEKLRPPRLPDGTFKPESMVDYYLAIASWLGADTSDKHLELSVDPAASESLKAKVPELTKAAGPVVVLVPGGAFGPSKCWPNARFSQMADRLIADYKATVVISVAPEPAERRIAGDICDLSRHRLANLGERPVTLSELKALFARADLAISNDTGPRHIGVALGRKVVSLFGPNDPAWTDTKYENEVQIIGNVPCAPCHDPVCGRNRHLCMESITVEMVLDAAKQLLEDDRRRSRIVTGPEFVGSAESFRVDPGYKGALAELGLTSIDAVFSFNAAENLNKKNLACFRSRLQFEIDLPESSQPRTVFLKRYDCPPVRDQLRNWLAARSRKSCGLLEYASTCELSAAGIGTPKPICYGEQWGTLFEKRSFIITEEIPNAEALERRLPDCFSEPATSENLRLRRSFIAELASFIKRFHETGYRHRDLYFSHIFFSDRGRFFLIDLARAFEPRFLSRRFQIKDLAQIYYSAPGRHFSRTDRLRFYLSYTGRRELSHQDKVCIRDVINKAQRMARHDRKHGRQVPFAS
ncbi:MAG: lipopolysaccharide heptosyltransferase II [Phycisphaerales bacterium]|nr:MAG: lipopolysaccharide heptosyltransferase II [Phycisphaerales bacterium]